MFKSSMTLVLVILCLVICISGVSATTIVLNGKANATIVIPDNATKAVAFAAKEMVYHVKESTGAELQVVTESQKPSSGDLIYLGPCKSVLAMGIDPSKLAPNAFRIKLTGRNLLMAGKDNDGDVITEPNGILQCNWTRMGTLFAVYEFLERQLDVKWLWPGKLGEVIPKRSSIVVKKWDQVYTPKLIHSRFRDIIPNTPNDWSSEEARVKFLGEQSLWLRRQRFAMGVNMDIHHSFTEYWSKFSKTNPDFFALLPDGTRRSDPYYCGGSPEVVSMCVSNPSLWKHIVEQWKVSRTDEIPYIDVSENDTDGRCTCEQCMAWDVPDPKHPELFATRLARSQEAFKSNDPAKRKNWTDELGSVSDRYAKYYLAVQKEAQKVAPGAVVMGFAYANYWQPPVSTKLNDRVVLGLVPAMYFPWTDEKREAFRKQWDGWAATGCKLMLRPNYTLDGYCMPINYARKFGEDFNYALKRGLIATDYDTLTGQYGTQGPNEYMVARLNAHPDWSADKVLNEYYRGFGPAKDAVRAYFAYWESISNRIDDKSFKNECKKVKCHGFTDFNRVAPSFFTPDVMAQGWAFLKKAQDAAQGDTVAEHRVAFLANGLRHADLALNVQNSFVKYRASDDMTDYASALNKLDAFRASMENDNIANMGFLCWSESMTWDRSLLRLLKGNITKISAGWKFMWDANKVGEKNGWNTDHFDSSAWNDIGVGSTYQQQEVGKKWISEHNGEDFHGIVWYNTAFNVDPKSAGRKISLVFGAVDEACTVWVNGKQVLNRPFPFNGDTNSWQEAFDVDITSVVRFDGPNSLSVRVENNEGAGGICKPVFLEISDPAL